MEGVCESLGNHFFSLNKLYICIHVHVYLLLHTHLTHGIHGTISDNNIYFSTKSQFARRRAKEVKSYIHRQLDK